MANQKFPYALTRSEMKRIIHNCRKPNQRIGQAVCNTYALPQYVIDTIWESDNFDYVVAVIWDNFHRIDYQNL